MSDSTGDDAAASPDDETTVSAEDIDELTASLADVLDRLEEVEAQVSWIAQKQAQEGGKSICPECNTGGALVADRTPAGKKQVKCRNCGERLS